MKIKKIFLIVVLFISYISFAQDEEFEDYNFGEEQIQEKSPYFALSFGVTSSFLFMNYDDINNKFGISPEIYKESHFSGPLTNIGFNFFTALSPLLNNSRLGIKYETGSKEVSFDVIPDFAPDSDGSINNYFSVSNSLIGIHYDYAFVPFKSFAILPGIGLQFGNFRMEKYITNTDNTDWGSIYDNIGESVNYSYIGLSPQINIEYAITGFLMIRLNTSYSFVFDNFIVSNPWTINGNNPYSQVPSSLKPSGFSANVGLFLGLFNY